VEHEEAFPGTEPAVGGAPDAGEGRYSDKLPYKQWIDFNNVVEMLPVILVTLVIGGLVLPRVTMWVAILHLVSRLIYTVSYVQKGANARIWGVITGLPIYAVLFWSFAKVAILAF
jgi:hypothetical protein